ncbi:MAG: glycoside hydrolase [Actinomycetota bacterium]|nr:glycoside hydrolase [Actinomycetota bacterium]
MNTEVDPRTPTSPADGGPPSSDTGDPRRKRVLAGALAFTLGLLVLAGALWWVLGRSGVRLKAGPNQPVNQDASMVSAHNSPTIAVSPTDRRFLAVAGRIDRPNYSASVHVSQDGGQTWSDSKLALPPGQSRPFEPQPAFDGQGSLFVLFSTLEAQGVIPNGLWLERSEDGGRTFSPPVKVADRFTYQPRLVINQASGNVHVTWLQASEAVVPEVAASLDQTSSEKPAPGLGPPPNPIVMATSRDGGATFSERAQVSDPRRERVGAASPAIAPNGDLYVLYQDYGADVTDFRGLPGGVHRGAFSLVMSRSTNTGSSFSTAGVAESAAVPFERFLVFLPKFPSLAIDPRNGTLYVAWSDNRNGDADVFVRHSDDGGRTWSRLARVDNHEDEPRHQQYLPKVDVAPNGRVDVLFLNGNDRSERLLTLAVLASSVDGGRTWEAIAVSSDAFDARIGPHNGPRDADGRGQADTGTTLGLVSTDDAAYTVWADSRRGTTETGSQDLFFAPVRVTRE